MEKNTEHEKETGFMWGFVNKDLRVGATKSYDSPRVLILGGGVNNVPLPP